MYKINNDRVPETFQIKDKNFELYIPLYKIRERISALAAQLNEQFKDEAPPVLIPVLTGSFVFVADLMQLLEFRYDINFIKISSYANEMESSGIPQEIVGLGFPLVGRKVIIIEDIIDTGITLDYVYDKLHAAEISDCMTLTLLFKECNFQGKHRPDWVGFEIGSAFVVGYGMDYAEQGRSFRAIYRLSEGNSEPKPE